MQWHAEFHPERSDNYINKILFKKFGESCQSINHEKIRWVFANYDAKTSTLASI